LCWSFCSTKKFFGCFNNIMSVLGYGRDEMLAVFLSKTYCLPIFTARCICISAVLCRHAVSVRPSVTLVSCVKTNKNIFEIFSPSGSHTILVFPYRTGWRYSDGNPPPLTRASNARGYEKNDDFRPISHSISETVIVRWAHAAWQFVSIEFSFHPYSI